MFGYDCFGFFWVFFYEFVNVLLGFYDFLYIVGMFFDQIIVDGEQIRNGIGIFFGVGDYLCIFLLYGGVCIGREGINGINLIGCECSGCLIGGYVFDYYVVVVYVCIFEGQVEQIVIYNVFFNGNGFVFEIGDGCDGGIGNDLVIVSRVVVYQNYYFIVVFIWQE